jgi:hypothetical protein
MSDAPTEKELETIERCAFMTFEALDQVATLLNLDPMRRHAALELLYYTVTSTSERQLPTDQKALLVELKRLLIERAERHYTENIAALTPGVNTTGGKG